MKTTKELDKDDIAAVVREHLERKGFEVTGVSVEVVKGNDAGGDPRERSTPDTVRALALVEEKAPRKRKGT